MKSYENNMADQDLVVHSLKVLSDIKNPALSQIDRELSLQKNTTQALATRTEKFYRSLSDDGIITPIEKKIVLREMESIATSYTALYQQAVAEHYDQAPFFQDYMATYAALHTYIYNTLHLFDNMEEETAVERDEFNQYFSDYYYSENITIVSMTVGIITQLGFKVLTSLEDPGEEGQIGIYHGSLYQYINGEWKIIDRELYYGKSNVLPPALEGRYFLCTEDTLLYDILYLNDEPVELNGETVELGTDYESGVIYVWENNHWQSKDSDDDYRYLVAMGDYYSVKNNLPPILKTEIENVARSAAGSTYYGALTVPPVNPNENDFFLYSGQTSGETPPTWVFASLYMYKNNQWNRLDESLAANQKYYMEALQDILTITESTSGYFSTVFCNAFFANQAAMNSLSTKVIYLRTNGALRSENYQAQTAGLLIDSDGNIDANGNTHIGGYCVIDEGAVIYGNISGATGTFEGDLNITGNALLRGRTVIDGDATFSGDIYSGPLELTSDSPAPIYYNFPAGSQIPFGFVGNVVGVYNNSISFTAYACGHSGGTGITFYKDGVEVYREDHYGVFTNYHTIDYSMSYYYNGTSGSKTFKLKNLPTTRPSASNIVWNDNGTLKIT